MTPTQRINLPVGEKILRLRKQHGISQNELAFIIRVLKEKVILVENGEGEYTNAELQLVKKHFGLEELPLTEHECDIFYKRLYHMRSLIRAKRLSEARDIQNELDNIDNLEPCDPDMVMLSKMFEIQLKIAEGLYTSAEKELDYYDSSGMNSENVYHYYYNKGYLCICKRDLEKGLEHLLRAYRLIEIYDGLLPEEDERLYYHLAICYTYLEIPYRSLFFAQKAKAICMNERIPNYSLHINRVLALNYAYTNQFEEAKKILEKCLDEYKTVKDDLLIGYTLLSFGYMYRQSKNWSIAKEYFNSALCCLSKGTVSYFSALYGKINCLIQTNAFIEAGQLLEDATNMCKGDNLWLIYFESLQQYLRISENISINNDRACNYIKTKALPHLYANRDYFIAIVYCRLLEQHYEKTNRTTESLQMIKEIMKIYERCYINHGEDAEV